MKNNTICNRARDILDLSGNELKRYIRHLFLPGIGVSGQKKLKDAKVLVVGAGGLGSPCLLYLASAGVGTIGIVEDDRVDESNLQRQVLYRSRDIGRSKIECAKAELTQRNPHIAVVVYPFRLTTDNAMDVIARYDLVVDGTDNFPTRYLINDACVLSDKPLVYGSVYQFEGQVSVFNLRDKNGDVGPNYRCLFPEPPDPKLVPNCALGGVLGVLPGIIGMIQASEVLKIITGVGVPLSGRVLFVDALKMTFQTIQLRHDPNNPLNGKSPSIKGLIDYHDFCSGGTTEAIKTIQPVALNKMRDSGMPLQLVDVRSRDEHERFNIGGILAPVDDILSIRDKISVTDPVVFYCKSGVRSRLAVETLQKEMGDSDLPFYTLDGGLVRYAEIVDPLILSKL